MMSITNLLTLPLFKTLNASLGLPPSQEEVNTLLLNKECEGLHTLVLVYAPASRLYHLPQLTSPPTLTCLGF